MLDALTRCPLALRPHHANIKLNFRFTQPIAGLAAALFVGAFQAMRAALAATLSASWAIKIAILVGLVVLGVVVVSGVAKLRGGREERRCSTVWAFSRLQPPPHGTPATCRRHSKGAAQSAPHRRPRRDPREPGAREARRQRKNPVRLFHPRSQRLLRDDGAGEEDPGPADHHCRLQGELQFTGRLHVHAMRTPLAAGLASKP